MTTEIEKEENFVHLTIDNMPVKVPKGTTVYTASKQLGIEIPIFCYQDRMPPFGACRVCLVEVEKFGKLQTSCSLEATEGMVVHTQSQKSVNERKNILEFLLINHPLDCPICDKGGECPLQDQALKFGPGESRFFEEKRHFKKALPLGPVLMLDRERCIVCARCTRFGDLISGDHALEFIERGYKTEVGTPDGKPVESKFIGNTINICPVGALTSQVYRFRARPWDNHTTKSTCSLCPVGCSTTIDERDGDIMRIRPSENKTLNDIWLCDKGFFGFEYIDNKERLTKPLIRRDGVLEEATIEEALTLIASKMQAAKGKGQIGAIGGNPLTIEENYLFQKLIREGCGVNHVDHRVGSCLFSLYEEGLPPGMNITVGDCEELSLAVFFGVDITEEFPLIWLRVKQALNTHKKVIFIGHYAPEISLQLTQTLIHSPGKELETLRQQLPHLMSLVAREKKCAFFVGRQYLNTPDRKNILSDLYACLENNPLLSLNVLEGEGNSMGARFAGMRPDILPLNRSLENTGLNALEIIEKSATEGWDFLYVAGANPALKYPKDLFEKARKNLSFLVVQDLFLTETAKLADVVLPTLSSLEKSGHFMTIDGRIQKINKVKTAYEYLLSDEEIFVKLCKSLSVDFTIEAALLSALEKGQIPFDQKAPLKTKKQAEIKEKESTDLSLVATFSKTLFDRGVRMQHSPHLKEIVKAPRIRIHPLEALKQHLKEGDTVSIVAKNKISGIVAIDPKVSIGTLVLPLGFPEFLVHELSPQLLNGLKIEIKKEAAYVI